MNHPLKPYGRFVAEIYVISVREWGVSYMHRDAEDEVGQRWNASRPHTKPLEEFEVLLQELKAQLMSPAKDQPVRAGNRYQIQFDLPLPAHVVTDQKTALIAGGKTIAGRFKGEKVLSIDVGKTFERLENVCKSLAPLFPSQYWEAVWEEIMEKNETG